MFFFIFFIFLDPVFLYVAVVAVSHMNLRWWAEPCAGKECDQCIFERLLLNTFRTKKKNFFLNVASMVLLIDIYLLYI